ncbi:Glycosyltransferase-like protein LARGE1 [Trichinella nelsoni]|uniref:Glycosyltransferase-like protein LARGE1 n=1 Tax=Trichinella nelsoni TaxID=6336 RepID=A0A0V0SJN1_9BILA|nr:Glycosyltransferase-like protein LARGE1 [Trichinella nelsoni]
MGNDHSSMVMSKATFLLVCNFSNNCYHRLLYISIKALFHGKFILEELHKNVKKKNILLSKDDFNTRCEVIHIAVVSGGFQSRLQLLTLLKSVLFYRSTPLHFHIVTDSDLSEKILRTLFSTWNLPSVSLSIYRLDEALEDINWIPNGHYSGLFGLSKLILPKILSTSVTKVVVLDVDILFVSDIFELWNFLSKFNDSQVLGMTENQSDWYLGNLFLDYKPWPALGRGYNSGVILMNLLKLRAINWTELYKAVTKELLNTYNRTNLADQDIFNAVIQRLPALVYRLPCVYNLQLNDNARRELCSYDQADMKIIHWNNYRKPLLENPNESHYRSLYQQFVDLDGNFLRHINKNCKLETAKPSVENISNNYDSFTNLCLPFKTASNLMHRMHLYFGNVVQFDLKLNDVTLLTQLSFDRLVSLNRLLIQWTGPIIAVLYLTDAEAFQLATFMENDFLNIRNNVIIHVVYKEGNLYPVNKLRNIALQSSITPFVFMNDIDFVPATGLYEHLLQILPQQGDAIASKKAYIVPAFEVYSYHVIIPESKTDLLKSLDSGEIHIFRSKEWVKGHLATDYDRWRNALEPYKIAWSTDFEPYFVVRRDVPLYDERFVGFGWNKVAHVMNLDFLNYEFIVLPFAYIVHLPHSPSLELLQYRQNSDYRRCLKLIMGQFIKELTKTQFKPGKQFQPIATNLSSLLHRNWLSAHGICQEFPCLYQKFGIMQITSWESCSCFGFGPAQFVFVTHETDVLREVYTFLHDFPGGISASGTSSIDTKFSDMTCKSAAVNLNDNFPSLQPTVYSTSHSAMMTTGKFFGSAGPRSTSGTLSVAF